MKTKRLYNGFFNKTRGGSRVFTAKPIETLATHQKKLSHFEERKFDIQARILEPDEWQAFIEALEQWPESTQQEKSRLRLIVYLLSYLGLRVNELTTHTWSAFRQIDGLWWFVVKGKGSKIAKVPVHEALWQFILKYRTQQNKSSIPCAD